MIKMRYVAQIEINDEIERTESVLSIDEIRQNIARGMIEESLKDIIAEGKGIIGSNKCCLPKIVSF